jgi:NAD(P)-dependent dehydrogenase (short-subunit alcohol dehydrogenase family)
VDRPAASGILPTKTLCCGTAHAAWKAVPRKAGCAQPRSVLVTGASSGIGRATVETFAAAGWQVAATMRRPEDGAGLATLAGVRVFSLDVTRAESVDAAVAAAHAAFGRLDAVVNNAGYAVDGVFEAASDEAIRGRFGPTSTAAAAS